MAYGKNKRKFKKSKKGGYRSTKQMRGGTRI